MVGGRVEFSFVGKRFCLASMQTLLSAEPKATLTVAFGS